jgi:hypothetical protein
VISTAPGQISPDGLWRWDGTRWVANQVAPAPVAPAAPALRSWLAISGGITAIFGAIVLGVGCAIPYVHYTGDVGSQSAWPSIFNGGFPGAWGNAVEPALVIVAVLTAATLVIAWAHRTVRGIMSGIMAAMGAQTMAMSLGFLAGAATYGDLQAGGFVAALGGLIIFSGGAMAAASLATNA